MNHGSRRDVAIIIQNQKFKIHNHYQMARTLISFDWAMKRLLRSKANFDILEGFLSELLGEDITILDILESESNKENKSGKFNRVDLKVKNSKGEFIIIELQYDREYDYLQRMLYGTSRVITEHQKESESYDTVVKVISVNILYFELGQGTDYVYHGKTSFVGIHDHDTLQLDSRQKERFGKLQIHSLYPEYYIIRINNFDSIARNTLDEWIYFLKNSEIPDNFKAKGIQKAKESFSVLRMSVEEYQAYQAFQDELRDEASYVETKRIDALYQGREEGFAEGMEKGKEIGVLEGMEKGKEIGVLEGKLEIARRLLASGISKKEVAAITGITVDLL
uniref:Rpn family recombination-promoting nuclease/putative transposase n=1 Tax=Chlorobium chlorochromatii (strain CaD3) TaxID=340177 RepID=Q3AR74_CHLCH